MPTPVVPSQLGFDPENTTATTPISLAESQELRAQARSLQNDWKLVVAQAVASAKLAEALEPRVQDLEQRIQALDQIASKLNELHSKIDELTTRPSKKRKL